MKQVKCNGGGVWTECEADYTHETHTFIAQQWIEAHRTCRRCLHDNVTAEW